ncbi:MAG: type I 3-dehydroquinate dehydratase [Planctomycetota bacterium]
MPTLVCVSIFVEDIDSALSDAQLAKDGGADLVEFRIDTFFDGGDDDDGGAYQLGQLRRLLDESPLPVILTCRPTWEGGEYDGDDSARVALFEKLCADGPSSGQHHPPAYLDVELAAYNRSKNLRQKINLCVQHPKQQRDVTTRLILSTHDFDGRPADLERRLLAAYEEKACAIVKVAFRARSLRDNLELFDILGRAPKPTIALGMGEFGLMSRVLAPKFGGFLTFASLRDTAATAPGQPILGELLGMYRFRKIGKDTKVYGVIGWPVSHSKSPLIHNAGFEELGWDGVYLPLPVAADEKDREASAVSFDATVRALESHRGLHFKGASITLPHKEHAANYGIKPINPGVDEAIGAVNMLKWFDVDLSDDPPVLCQMTNTDAAAIIKVLKSALPDRSFDSLRVKIYGAGGVARAAAAALAVEGAIVEIENRDYVRAINLASDLEQALTHISGAGLICVNEKGTESPHPADLYINCTPVGMTDGPDPDGLSIPITDMPHIDEDTVFFDTVYTPAETPMLKAARERGCRTIDGVQMFVKQAAAQFELWTGHRAPVELFDKLVRESV